jgi:lysophospholipase L1-like esterase
MGGLHTPGIQLGDNITGATFVSMTNLVSNGNFASVWTNSNATHTVANNVGSVLATAQNGTIYTSVALVDGHKYYFKVAISTDAVANSIHVYPVGYSGVYNVADEDYQNIAFIITATATNNVVLRIRDERASDWSTFTVKDVIAVDITASFGAGNEPAQASTITDYLYNYDHDTSWFSGTQNVATVDSNANKFLASVGGVLDAYLLDEIVKAVGMNLNTPITGITSTTVEGAIGELATQGNLYGKKIVCFGDSVTELGDYPTHIATKTGAEVVNVGFGGCWMGTHTDSDYANFGMSQLATAIATATWTLQDASAAHLAAEHSDDNTAILTRLKAIDWYTVDIVTINYGTNDWDSNFALGALGDTAATSFFGAMYAAINTLLTAYGHLQVVLISPTWRKTSGNDCDTTANAGGKYLYEFVDAMISTAQKFHIPYLDMFRTSGFNSYTAATYINGDVHPTTAGYKKFGEKVGAYLLSLF